VIRLPDFVADSITVTSVGIRMGAMLDSTEGWSLDAVLADMDLSKLHAGLRPLRIEGTLHLTTGSAAVEAISAQARLRAREPVAAELTLDLRSSADQCG